MDWSDQRLWRAPHVDLRLSREGATIDLPSGPLALGANLLAILDVFSQPSTVKDAVEQLGARMTSPQAWRHLWAEVMALKDAGVLVDVDESTSEHSTRAHAAFTSPGAHVAMLNDVGRTAAFIEAIRSAVGPDDVVIDIGTGTGILAVSAALAGARRVFAVEVTAFAEVARQIAEENGVADRVTVLNGWSNEIELPERATVLVTETIGDDPLGERILGIVSDARRRLLEPGARIIPSGLRLMAQLVAISDGDRERAFFTPSSIERWEAQYGVRLKALGNQNVNRAQMVLMKPRPAAGWRSVGDSVELVHIDFHAVDKSELDVRATVVPQADDEVDGVVVSFEADLGPSISIVRSWNDPAAGNHWRAPAWITARPMAIRAGEAIEICYRSPGPGVPESSRAAVQPVSTS